MDLPARSRLPTLCFDRASLLVAALLGGCVTVGPDYVEPEIPVPDAWHQTISAEVEAGPTAPLQTWWSVFDDPVLDGLIERARSANLDVQTAASRVREARAWLALDRGEQLPVVGAEGKAGSSLQSDNGWLAQIAPEGGFESQNIYELGFGASWELDVFGRIRRTVESAEAQYQAAIEAERDVRVMLFADVALAYLELREFQNRAALAESSAAAQEQVLKLAEERYSTGLTSKLDVVQARANLDMTRAVIPKLETAQSQTLDRLAVLLGADAGTLRGDLATTAPIPSARENVATGVPADLLRQRPDVRRAERELAAQTARVGVATADLYPNFSLTGLLGLQSRSTDDVFDGNSKLWSVSLPVQWSLYNGGRVRSNIRIHEERTEQALFAYRQSVLEALAEVEGALAALDDDRQRVKYLEGAVEAIREAARLALVQYNTGLTDFVNVMLMQRYLFELEGHLATTQAEVGMDVVGVYKAMGGGW